MAPWLGPSFLQSFVLGPVDPSFLPNIIFSKSDHISDFYETLFFLSQVTSRNVIREKNKITLDKIYILQKGRAHGPQYHSANKTGSVAGSRAPMTAPQ